MSNAQLFYFERDEDFLWEGLIIKYVGSHYYTDDTFPDNHILISERWFHYEESPTHKSHAVDYAVVFAISNTNYDFVSTPNGLQLYGNGLPLSSEAYKNALLLHYGLSSLYDRISEVSHKILTDDIGDIYAYGHIGNTYEGFFRHRPYYIERIENLTSEAFRLKDARPGYIYLVQAVIPNNLYKIGLSKKPIKRIEKLGVKLPFPIEPIHTFATNDRYGCEKYLHEKFDDKRVNGEWFELTDEDVNYIKSFPYFHVEGVKNKYPSGFSQEGIAS